MKRTLTSELADWYAKAPHKPLVLRGARQVGKSHLVRAFADAHAGAIVELNFERDRQAAKLFANSNDPVTIVRAIELFAKQSVEPGKTLLFLDEIQAAPEILAKLRWFAEELPELHVVAAGSLLDFVLASHSFSMPVGRIRYLHLEPMSFKEFLWALGETMLAEHLAVIGLQAALPEPIHDRLLQLLREYMLVGGMPAAVEAYRRDRSLLSCARVHEDLLTTYRDDFAKYAPRVAQERLAKVMQAVPRQLGKKFKYVSVDRDERSVALRQAFDLLTKARVCHRVQATAATGIPLGAEANDRQFKAIFLDVGLVSAALGLSSDPTIDVESLVLANEGALAEQVVGQMLRLLEPPFKEPELYYWAREERGSEAELDYVIQHRAKVLPIEVKAGSTGSLKSLHGFMSQRQLPIAVRFNASPPSIVDLDVRVKDGRQATYKLLSLPLYMVSEAPRIIDEL